MKKILLISLLLFLSKLYAKNIQQILGIDTPVLSYDNNPVETFFFDKNNKVKVVSYSRREDINIFQGYCDYNFYEKNHITYLDISNDKIKKTFTVLINEELLILYEKGKSKPFWEGINSKWHERFYYWDEYEWLVHKTLVASSELKEGDTIYTVRNLGTLENGKPWVEGVSGYGCGEYITNKIRGRTIFIFPGFFDADRPSLYEKNSRPKKILIETPNFKKEIILKDSPNPQKIIIDEKKTDEEYVRDEYEIKITILEVYPGTKYKDTCINAIMGIIK